MDPVADTQQGHTHHNEDHQISYVADPILRQMQKILINLDELECAIPKGELDTVTNIFNFFEQELLPNENLLSKLCKVREFLAYDLVITACRHKQADILFYLVRETDILRFLPPTNTTTDLMKVDELQYTSFHYAMLSNNMDIFALMYEYWRGDTHLSAYDDNDKIIESISRLGDLLKKAYYACKTDLAYKDKMKKGVHCFIKFNDFQHDVYKKLRELTNEPDFKNTKDEAIRAQKVIKQVLSVYKNYSKFKKAPLDKETTDEEKQQMKQNLEDKSTLYYKWWVYLNYEEYFIRLDSFVSSMIVDNLNILKKSDVDVNEIESRVFHYIFRAFDGWRMYLPQNSTITKEVSKGMLNGQEINVEVEYDIAKLDKASVLFLERRQLKRCFKNFTTVPNLSSKKRNNNDMDLNYLQLSPCMKDFYSLKKMVYYLEAVEMNKGNILVIERALQVIGEMMKSTKDCNHLSVTTKALLETEISVETIRSIIAIRDFISNKNTTNLWVRMEVVKNNDLTFSKIKRDLEKIKEGIISVLNIYELIVYKSFLENGLTLINERIEEWRAKHPAASQHENEIMKRYYENNISDQAFFDDFMKEVWNETSCREGLLKEITYTLVNKKDLLCRMEKLDEHIKDVGTSKLPQYITTVEDRLKTIQSNKRDWDSLKDDLRKNNIQFKNHLVDYPIATSINQIKSKLESMMKKKSTFNDEKIIKDLLDRLKGIKDFSKTWKSIQLTLTFFHDEISIIDKDALSTDISNDAINTILKIKNTKTHTKIQSPILLPTFDGIEQLKTKLMTQLCNGDVERIRFDILINKVALLKKTIGYPKKLPLDLMRDQNFRIPVEMLMNDIGSIFRDCALKHLMDKSAKLLAGVNLRNVLAHGNPFLEVIGDVLDPNDLSTELMSKAMMVAEDGESIEALYKLFNDGIDSETIDDQSKQDALNEDQKETIQQFKRSKRWKDYLKLLP